jgi:transcriptional regulator with XRE-family HTH domain
VFHGVFFPESAMVKPRTALAIAVREARLDLRMSQHAFADALGNSLHTISRWESSHTDIPLEYRIRIMNLLANGAPGSRARTAAAFGVHVASTTTPSPAGAAAPKPTGAAVAAAVTGAIRAAADDVDVSPNKVRRIVAAVLARLREANVSLGDPAVVAEVAPKPIAKS